MFDPIAPFCHLVSHCLRIDKIIFIFVYFIFLDISFENDFQKTKLQNSDWKTRSIEALKLYFEILF